MNDRWIARCPRCGKKHERALWLRPLERNDRIHRCRQCGKLFAVCALAADPSR
ncbi:MAG: hypothetical protein WD069_14860 [Planctomycetales bacterium]